MTEAWRAVVEGRVQGVGFRYSAQRQAAGLGLAGWVRNNPGGEVELFVQGESGAVARFLGWLGQGPPMATVTALRKSPAEFQETLRRFTIA